MIKKDIVPLARKIKNYCNSIYNNKDDKCCNKCDKRIKDYCRCHDGYKHFGASNIKVITNVLYKRIELLNAIEFINNYDDKKDELLNIVSENYKAFNQFDVKNNMKNIDLKIGEKIKKYCVQLGIKYRNKKISICYEKCNKTIAEFCDFIGNCMEEKDIDEIDNAFFSNENLLTEKQKQEIIKLLDGK